MDKKTEEIVETEILDAVEPEVIETPDVSIKELSTQYNGIKKSTSKALSSLGGDMTIGGMDKVNELVSGAMKDIQSFVDNGREKSFIEKSTSRAVALIDPNNKWAGKWINSAKDTLAEESHKEKTINEIVDILVSQIEEKRQEVLDTIEIDTEIKDGMIHDGETFLKILDQAEKVAAAEENQTSRTAMEAKFLILQLKTSIQSLEDTIRGQVEPLIASNALLCEQIAAVIPTLETELRYSGRFKTSQQKAMDLAGMVKTTLALATETSDIIRKDVHETIYESIGMIGESGIDTARRLKMNEENEVHHKKVQKAMGDTMDRIQKDFDTINGIYSEHRLAHKKEDNALLEAYSKAKDEQD